MSLRARIGHRARPVDDEVAAELQRVQARPSQARAMRKFARVAQPHVRIAPDPKERSALEAPGAVDAPLLVDKHWIGNREVVQQRVAQSLRRVEGDEQRRAELVDPLPVMEHLHEVRATDQSAGMTKEDQQEGAPAEILEPQTSSCEIGEIERPCALAGTWRRRGGHLESPLPADASNRSCFTMPTR